MVVKPTDGPLMQYFGHGGEVNRDIKDQIKLLETRPPLSSRKRSQKDFELLFVFRIMRSTLTSIACSYIIPCGLYLIIFDLGGRFCR